MRKLFYTFALVFAGATALHAQSIGPSTINGSGGSANIGGSTFEFAIGDVVDGSTFSSASLVVTPGTLQPVFPTGIGTTPGMISGLSVYPSPVQSILYIQPSMNNRGTLKYVLFDAGGRLVMSKSTALIQGNERQQADVQSLAVGQYTLQIQWTEGTMVQTGVYKIQKLN